MLSGIHLCNVSKPKRSSLVKLYIDYLLLKQFQRPEVLSAQMWVQLQSGARRKINIFLIWFFGNGSSWEMKKEVGKYNVSKTVLVIYNMIFCLFLFWLLFLYTGSDILNLLNFSLEGLLKGKSCRISLQWLKLKGLKRRGWGGLCMVLFKQWTSSGKTYGVTTTTPHHALHVIS